MWVGTEVQQSRPSKRNSVVVKVPSHFGTGSCTVLAIYLVTIGWVLANQECVLAQPTTGVGWLGKRVVQKSDDFNLHVEDRVVDRGRRILFYRVEQVKGPWLWLKAEGQDLRGWALVESVIPVQKGIDYFTRQVLEDPQDAFSYMMRATLHHDRGQLDRALDDYDKAIGIDHDHAWVFNNRGITWFEQGQYDQALADFTHAIRMEPHAAIVYNNRGNVWRAKKVFNAAIDDYNEAIRLDPGYVAAYYDRGLAWAEKEEFDKAIADYDTVIRLAPRDALAHYHRGIARLVRNEYDAAIVDFDQALKLHPKLAVAYHQRGIARLAKDQYDRALTDLDRAIQGDPLNADAYFHRGLVRSGRKEYGKALADYEQAIRIDPGFPDAYLNRAWLYIACPDARYRDPRRAVESATKACELRGWKEAYDLGTLAAACAEAHDFEAASKWQTRSTELWAREKPNAGNARHGGTRGVGDARNRAPNEAEACGGRSHERVLGLSGGAINSQPSPGSQDPVSSTAEGVLRSRRTQ